MLKEPDSALVDRIASIKPGKRQYCSCPCLRFKEEFTNEEAQSKLIDEGITKEDLATRITDYLAKLATKHKKNPSLF